MRIKRLRVSRTSAQTHLTLGRALWWTPGQGMAPCALEDYTGDATKLKAWFKDFYPGWD